MQHIVNIFFNNLAYIFKNRMALVAMMRLFWCYFGKNPYRISAKQLQDQSFTYGETPLLVFSEMLLHIKQGEHFTDLGSGRGKGLLYMASLRGEVHFHGVEALDIFCENGIRIAQKSGFKNVTLSCMDLRKEMIPVSDVYYLAGTCFDDKLLIKLAIDLNVNKPRLIFSLSTSLIEYGLQGYQMREKEVTMPWGDTTLYILKRS